MPFPERVRSIAITCGGGVLVLGTEGGRLILWEVGDVILILDLEGLQLEYSLTRYICRYVPAVRSQVPLRIYTQLRPWL